MSWELHEIDGDLSLEIAVIGWSWEVHENGNQSGNGFSKSMGNLSLEISRTF